MAPTNLDMDVMRSFVACVELGSSVRAAERIGRSQSAISLQLRKLERQCQHALFRKHGRKLLLTDAGETMFRFAVRLLDLNDEALSVVNRGAMSGHIRLGMPPDVAETWLPDLLGRFARANPSVIVEARVDRAAALLDDLAKGGLDLSLLWSDETARTDDSSGRSLASFPMVWVGAADFEVTRPIEQPLPLVLMSAPCLFRSRGLSALDRVGISSRLTFTSHSLSGLWAAVAAGLGLTIRTPEGVPAGLRILDPGKLGLPDLGRASLRLHIRSAASPATERFVEILDQSLSARVGAAEVSGATPSWRGGRDRQILTCVPSRDL